MAPKPLKIIAPIQNNFLIAVIIVLGCFVCSVNARNNTILLAGGYPELLDIEYQRSFDPFYIACKPGFIVMLIAHSQTLEWSFYPSLRLGTDLLRFQALKIGFQLEYAYLYDPKTSTLVASHAFPIQSAIESRSDHTFLTLGPALRFMTLNVELQASAGVSMENYIKFTKTTQDGSVTHQTAYSPLEFHPMIRLGVGYRF